MCWGWKRGGGNGGQVGVCEDFQPPPGSGTWLWAACLTPQHLAPRLWIIFCYGDSKHLFLHIWGIWRLPSLCVSAAAWEGERRAWSLPYLHVLGRGQVLLLMAFALVPMSSLVWDIILICSTTNLLQSIRRVMCLYTDTCYECNVEFMITPLDLIIALNVGVFFHCLRNTLSLSLSTSLSKGKNNPFIFLPQKNVHKEGNSNTCEYLPMCLFYVLKNIWGCNLKYYKKCMKSSLMSDKGFLTVKQLCIHVTFTTH